MKPSTKSVRDYIELRRSLGYKLRWIPTLLDGSVCFLKKRKASRITTPLALKWAGIDPSYQPATVARRLSTVRGFARYWHGCDPSTEVPAQRLLSRRHRHLK